MLLQPEKIVLVQSADEELVVDEVAIPSGSIVHFDTDKGSFRFTHQNGNLHPRCRDDRVLSTMLDDVMRATPGAGDAHYSLVEWTASSRLKVDDRTVICKDRFATRAELTVFAVGLIKEVELGPINRMRVFTP